MSRSVISILGLLLTTMLCCSTTTTLAFTTTSGSINNVFGVVQTKPCSTTTTTTLMMGSNDNNDAPQGIQKGTVKWFNTVKGFGFIQPDDGSTDVFVHQTSIQMEGFRSLADGESVEYQVEIDQNGRKKAASVTGPNGSDVQGAPFQPQNDYDRY